MPGRSRRRVAAGRQDPRGGRLPRQPQSPALPEQMAPGVSAGALLTLFSAGPGSRLPPPFRGAAGPRSPSLRSCGALRGVAVTLLGVAAGSQPRVRREPGVLARDRRVGTLWVLVVAGREPGQNCPASRGCRPASGCRPGVPGAQAVPRSGGPRNRRAPVWLQCSSADVLPIPKPIAGCGAWSGRCPLDNTGPWYHVCSESEDVELETVTPQRRFFRVRLNLGCCCILAPSPLRGTLQLGRASRWAE